jgi:prenyltransferase beta subunit
MMAATGRAKTILNDSATLVADFLRSRLNKDGGFADRNGKSDLYYTAFGIEALLTLQADFVRPKVMNYLDSQDINTLDFIHSACLARSLVNLQVHIDKPLSDAILHNIENAKCPDGGFSRDGLQTADIYGSFFALCAYQDLNTEPPGKKQMLKFIDSLRQKNGAYLNESTSTGGLSSSTAAAITILNSLNAPVSDSTINWLMDRYCEDGGFCAVENIPIPDLLSTATVLHALCVNDVDISRLKQQTLNFLDTLWSSRGAFCGSCADDTLDCEYTYYGLLALGHLGDK